MFKTKVVNRQRKGYSSRENKRMRARPRVYVNISDETILENLINRHDRPIKQLRKFAEQALDEQGFSDVKIRWSQYAGCRCPCSPGFIMTQWQRSQQETPHFDVFVSVVKDDIAPTTA